MKIHITLKRLTWATAATLIPVAFLIAAVVGEAASFRSGTFPGERPEQSVAEISLTAEHPLTAQSDVLEDDPSAESFNISGASLALTVTSGGSFTPGDAATACGAPVAATAEGLVVETGNPEDWNDGYGGFIEIEHPNGTATRYAHLSKILVSPGSYVKRLEKIGEIGNTGNVVGPTGCRR